MKDLAKRTICTDGVSLSIQASKHHYCTPRLDNGPYLAVEIGFIQNADASPLTPPETWSEYADGEFPSDVYGYVPIELVEEFIESHGGRK